MSSPTPFLMVAARSISTETVFWTAVLLRLKMEVWLVINPPHSGYFRMIGIDSANNLIISNLFEANGTEVDLNEIDEVLCKRVSKWRLAIKFAKLIAKYGKKASNYIYCVGTSAMWKCGDEVGSIIGF
jgi:hypothetical protein